MGCPCEETKPAVQVAQEMGGPRPPCTGPQSWMNGLRYSPKSTSRFAYISGPMRGIPNFNFEAFYAAEEQLLAAGWNTINPARMDDNCPGGTTHPVDVYIERDIEAIKALNVQVDALVTIEGARGEFSRARTDLGFGPVIYPEAVAKGSLAEIALAEWRGLRVLTVDEAVADQPDPNLLPTPGFNVWQLGERTTTLPTGMQERKDIPLVRGCLDYFPKALAEVAHVSLVGGRQHGHGDDIFWERKKSHDHPDCIARHLVERGTLDKDGLRHSAKVAWRALAMLELELEAEGAPMSRGSREGK